MSKWALLCLNLLVLLIILIFLLLINDKPDCLRMLEPIVDYSIKIGPINKSLHSKSSLSHLGSFQEFLLNGSVSLKGGGQMENFIRKVNEHVGSRAVAIATKQRSVKLEASK